MFGSHISFSIEVFAALAVASASAVVSHASLVIPSPTSYISTRSRSWRTCNVSRCSTCCEVSSLAPARAVPTIFASVTAPGRITFALIRYSRARLNSSVGESCSIARSNKNCSSSFISRLPSAAVFHPRYLVTLAR
jgi:hypothetical protein